MKLESQTGDSLALSIHGYQFPLMTSPPDDDWDANWLVIRGSVVSGPLSWSFSDPCMTTWEALSLAEWLHAMSADKGEFADILWMTEPDLTFGADGCDAETIHLSVYLSAEASPPGESANAEAELGHRVRLAVPRHRFRDALSDWNRELNRYPPR